MEMLFSCSTNVESMLLSVLRGNSVGWLSSEQLMYVCIPLSNAYTHIIAARRWVEKNLSHSLFEYKILFK